MVATGFIAEQIVFGACSILQFLMFAHLCTLSSCTNRIKSTSSSHGLSLAMSARQHRSTSTVSTNAPPPAAATPRPAGKLQRIFHRLGLIGSAINLVRTVDRSGVYDIYPVGLSMMLNLNGNSKTIKYNC